MTYFVTSEEWQRQSALLLRACPSSTRITTKYHVPSATEQAPDATQPTAPLKAYLELKTYDPATGACLKYKTDKAAEVGRLIATLGTLGRDMAALPEVAQDVAMPDAPTPSGQETPLPEQAQTDQKPAAGKKKKKGKK